MSPGNEGNAQRSRRSRRPYRTSRRAFVTFPDYLGPQVDAYATTAVSLTYRDLLPKLSVQLLADNVFDKQYWAVGSETLPAVLQNGRTVSVRMIYRLK